MEERWRVESSPVHRAIWEHGVGLEAFDSAALELGARLTGLRPTGEVYQLLTELGRAVAEEHHEGRAGASSLGARMHRLLQLREGLPRGGYQLVNQQAADSPVGAALLRLQLPHLAAGSHVGLCSRGSASRQD